MHKSIISCRAVAEKTHPQQKLIFLFCKLHKIKIKGVGRAVASRRAATRATVNRNHGATAGQSSNIRIDCQAITKSTRKLQAVGPSNEQQIWATEKFLSKCVGWLAEQWRNFGQLVEEIKSVFGARRNKHMVVFCRSRNGNGLSQGLKIGWMEHQIFSLGKRG